MRKKIYLSAAIGNILESYDFALYGFFAILFSELFFSETSEINKLIYSFMVFAIGFLARPIGSAIFGYIGDRWARNASLSWTIIGMGLSSFALGFLPTYKEVGIAAPILLTIVRIIQGLCVGGELSNAAVFTSEHLYEEKARFPALIMGLILSASIIGWLIALFMHLLFIKGYYTSWRFPFIVGGITALIGYLIRKYTSDAAFTQTKKQISLKESMASMFASPLSTLQTFSIGALMGELFYGGFIFSYSFLPKVSTLSATTINQLVTYGLLSYTLSLPIFGLIADKLGHKKMIVICSLATSFLSYFIFLLLTSNNFTYILIAEVIIGILVGGFFASGALLMGFLFPSRNRSFATSLSYNLGVTLFGGWTPTIFLLIYKQTQIAYAPFIYLLVTSLIFMSILALPNRNMRLFQVQ